MNVGSLFSGIGGFDLGLERAGMRTVWFCEQDPFCRRVLAKHWPGVPCHPDVRTLVADAGRIEQPEVAQGAYGERNERGGSLHGRRAEQPAGAGAGGRDGNGDHSEGDGGTDGRRATASDVGVPVSVPYVDVLCGGFPCQDISLAGRGAGIGGSRSGLWGEFARLIGELRPRYVIVENVPAITSRGLDRVLADLAACGFDAEWDHLPASAFGAPHRRDRFWLVACPQVDGRGSGRPGGPAPGGEGQRVAVGAFQDMGHTDVARLEGHRRPNERAGERAVGSAGWWLSEPDVGRVAHGVPARVDRLRSLGNSLVPQIAEYIGMRIIEYEEARAAA